MRWSPKLVVACTALAASGLLVQSCDQATELPTTTPITEFSKPLLTAAYSHDPAASCMYDEAAFVGQSLNCTAGDVTWQNIQAPGAPVECQAGDIITIPTIVADLNNTSNSDRGDVGFWIANDGGDGKNGQCSFDYLDPIAYPDGDLDGCGGLGGSVTSPLTVSSLQVTCEDLSGNGKLDVGICNGYKVPGDNLPSKPEALCPDDGDGDGTPNEDPDDFIYRTLPGNAAKCGCFTIELDITVNQVATIEVKKVVSPSSDPGPFNLQIDGSNEATDVGDGGTTGPVQVSAGTSQSPGALHTVGEVEGTTNIGLEFYNTTYACTDQDGPVTSGNGAGPVDVTADPDDAIVCTFTNTRIPAPTVTISKDVTATFDRDWTWTLDKTGDQTGDVPISPGQTLPVNYTVTVGATNTDDNFDVSGTITVSVAGTFPLYDGAFTVSDALNDGSTVTVDCGGASDMFQVNAAGDYTCSYAASPTDASATENTATVDVTWNSGDTDQQSSAAVAVSYAILNETDEEADLTDDNPEFHLAFPAPVTLDANAPGGPFTYSKDLVCPANEGTVLNTATLTPNDVDAPLQDTHFVNVLCPQPPNVCTLTQGYWKTHSEQGPARWPDDTWDLVGGPDAPFLLSGQTYLEVLWTPPQGNVYYVLAHQYIAAELNILNGASPSGATQDAFDDASQLLAACTPGDLAGVKGKRNETCSGLGLTRSEIAELADILTGFNESGHDQPQCAEEPNG